MAHVGEKRALRQIRLRSRLLGGCEFGGAGRNPLLKVLAMTFQFRCSARRS